MEAATNIISDIVSEYGSQWTLPGLFGLSAELGGDPEIRVAVIDGPVDMQHPCLAHAALRVGSGATQRGHRPNASSSHGTHVASVIFAHPQSVVRGIAPGCTGMIVPVYRQNHNGQLAGCSQRDLARAINQACSEGAHIIGISGGVLLRNRAPDSFLRDAVTRCADNGTLIIAAAGNEGCECDHFPASLPAVLAVGAADLDRRPLPFSNWGTGMQAHGVVAPGVDVRGAQPGGGVCYQTGTSFATPVVVGIAALLLSLQRRHGQEPNPMAIRRALLAGASPCEPGQVADCRRMLVGHIDIPGACRELGLPVPRPEPLNHALLAASNHREHTSVSANELLPRVKEGSMNPNNDSVPASVAPAGAVAHSSSTSATGLATQSSGNVSPAASYSSPASAAASTGAVAVSPSAAAASTSAAVPGGAASPSAASAAAAPLSAASTVALPSAAAASVGSDAGAAVPTAAAVVPPSSHALAGYPAGSMPGGFMPAPMQGVQPASMVPVAGYGSAGVPMGLNSAVVPAGCPCGGQTVAPSSVGHSASVRPSARPEMSAPGFPRSDSQLVFALGQLSYDFGTEARRDYFIQQFDGKVAGIFDPVQMSDYLGGGSQGDGHYQDANALIWTLVLDGTPMYAIDPQDDYAVLIYARLVKFLQAQEHESVERISIAGEIVGTTRLFNGEVVPTIAPVYRGMFNWSTEHLVQALTFGSSGHLSSHEEDSVNRGLTEFLQRVYYELRNLGTAPTERAMNFAATNAFQAHEVFVDAQRENLKLQHIEVERSPICRPESDCWDVKMIFFDPQRIHERARRVYRYTIDVVDMVPVTVGELRVWDMY